ncbi:MAG: cysteine hydrolase [Lachnospiraceae bacterium]|nr:cysteine hydrolase [Lachnospiraceae bacterium]
MAKLLIVVDMQNDFIDGSLGTKEALEIVPRVLEKVRGFEGEVIFTQDSHGENYLDTQEGKNLPIRHCIEGTDGWQIREELRPYITKNWRKDTFGSFSLAEAISQMEGVESIELVGLCTDICVVSNALIIKAYNREIPMIVDSSCCAGVTPEKHEAALEVMRSCQIQVI